MTVQEPILRFMATSVPLGVPVAALQHLQVEKPVEPIPFAVPALAGLGRGPEGWLPILDLRGLVTPSVRPPLHVEGATIAVLTTGRGPVGLRMDTLLGTVTDSEVVQDHLVAEAAVRALPPSLQACVSCLRQAHGTQFFHFSPEALLIQLHLPIS